MLEAQNEELREEVESLRRQLELQPVSADKHINGSVNGSTSPMGTNASLLHQSNGTYPSILINSTLCAELW